MARVVVAPASFKGFATPRQAAEAMAVGVRSAGQEAVLCPLADGGEGTLEALATAGGRILWTKTVNPLGAPCRGRILVWPRRRHAFVELAEAAGWQRLRRRRNTIWQASTYGVGLLIRRALEERPRAITVGLGGSVTNDGGAGLLSALGARLLDRYGETVPPAPAYFERLAKLDLEPARRLLAGVRLEVLADVDSPLLGPDGATYVYAPQKGATPSDLPRLEAAMARYAEVLAAACSRPLQAEPFAGAAGGTAAALLALGAHPLPGAATVARVVGLRRALSGASLLLTGEGRLDQQTLRGKAPFLAVQAARRNGVPAAMLVGQPGPNLLADWGVTLYPVTSEPLRPAETRRRLPELLAAAAERAVLHLLRTT